MMPHSHKHNRKYRIKTQEQKSLKRCMETAKANPNSIVFQAQVTSLKNYFQFLQTTFGKKVEFQQIAKEKPQNKLITEQLDRLFTKRRSKSEYIHEVAGCDQAKIKSSTTGGLDQYCKAKSYRNHCKYSLVEMPSSRLKAKYYDSQRKRHSYLMQRMNEIPQRINTSYISNDQFLNKDQEGDFYPVGRCITKEDNRKSHKKNKEKLSDALLRGITYRRPKHEIVVVKAHSQFKNQRHRTEKKEQVTAEGPWRIIDTTEYNPRSYYSAYR